MLEVDCSDPLEMGRNDPLKVGRNDLLKVGRNDPLKMGPCWDNNILVGDFLSTPSVICIQIHYGFVAMIAAVFEMLYRTGGLKTCKRNTCGSNLQQLFFSGTARAARRT